MKVSFPEEDLERMNFSFGTMNYFGMYSEMGKVLVFQANIPSHLYWDVYSL